MSRRTMDVVAGAQAASGLEQRLLARLRALPLNERDGPLLVGFSGGPDSLALAAALGRVTPLAGSTVQLVHVDHGLRPNSEREAARASELAVALGLTCTVVRVEPHARTRHRGVGVEEAARRERYRLFGAVLARTGAALVALAHHETDQAETVLLHLLRGAGVHGASGMAELTILNVPWWEPPVWRFRVWRPLLTEPRESVRRYAADLRLDPIEDESNRTTTYRRNALRHEALPVLERLQPGAVAALARFATIAAEEDKALAGLASEALNASRTSDHGLSVSTLSSYQLALRRRVVYAWLRERIGQEPSQERVGAVIELTSRSSERQIIEVGGDDRVILLGDELRLGTLEELDESIRREYPGPLAAVDAGDVRADLGPLIVGGARRISGWWVAVANDDEQHLAASGYVAVSLPRRAFEDQPVIRSVRPGDRWATSNRRIADWVRRHADSASPWVRRRLLCVASDQGVWWVIGLPLPTGEQALQDQDGIEVSIWREGEPSGDQ